MGGFGSGRWQRGKDTTADMRALDVRRIHRKGLLTPSQAFNWRWSRNGEEMGFIYIRSELGRVTLHYKSREYGGEWQRMSYPVLLDWTPCNFGGLRPWFLCPICGRRVAILYGGAIFACRHCHQLVYQCQQETYRDPATRRADKIRDRLGWESGILNSNGEKPKGMHWRTFERLRAEHDALVQSALLGIVKRFGL